MTKIVSCETLQTRLVSALDRHAGLAIAVSGGVDSMILAYIAHRFSQASVTMVHAVSPAVPRAATERVKRYAQQYGWSLQCIDAAEFANSAYRANPVDRCFHCKSSLYDSIRATTGSQIVSGTNMDDLTDYRPGLQAAALREVAHPFVEAGLHKADIYALAQWHKLDDLAALPAQPCLASRVETGIAIDPESLHFVEKVELLMQRLLPTIENRRCRITSQGVFVECAPQPSVSELQRVHEQVSALCTQFGISYGGYRQYRRGSAFLVKELAA